MCLNFNIVHYRIGDVKIPCKYNILYSCIVRKFLILLNYCSSSSMVCSSLSKVCSCLFPVCSSLSLACSSLSMVCSCLSLACSSSSMVCSCLSLACNCLSLACSRLSLAFSILSLFCSSPSMVCSCLSLSCSRPGLLQLPIAALLLLLELVNLLGIVLGVVAAVQRGAGLRLLLLTLVDHPSSRSCIFWDVSPQNV